MASPHSCTRSFQPLVGFQRPLYTPLTSLVTFHAPRRAAFPPTHFNFRFNNAIIVQLRQRLLPISASNTNPSGGSDKSSDASGPPLATILAGVFVFCVVCWIVGSVVLWLLSLIVNVPPRK